MPGAAKAATGLGAVEGIPAPGDREMSPDEVHAEIAEDWIDPNDEGIDVPAQPAYEGIHPEIAVADEICDDEAVA